MFCDKCGKNNTDGAKFCAGCGAPLNAAEPVRPEVETPAAQTADTRTSLFGTPEEKARLEALYARKKSRNALITFILAGVVAIVNIAMVFLPSIVIDVKKVRDQQTVYVRGGMTKEQQDKLQDAANKMKVIQTSFNFLKNEEVEKASKDPYPLSMFTFCTQNFDNRFDDSKGVSNNDTKYVVKHSDYVVRGVVLLILMIAPLPVLAVAAVFSFLRKKIASRLMLIGSIIYTAVSAYWLAFLLNWAPLGAVFFNGATSNFGEYKGGEYGANTFFLLTAVPFIMVALGIAGMVIASYQSQNFKNLKADQPNQNF